MHIPLPGYKFPHPGFEFPYHGIMFPCCIQELAADIWQKYNLPVMIVEDENLVLIRKSPEATE